MDDAIRLRERAALYWLLTRLYTYPLDRAALDLLVGLRAEDAPAALGDALAVMQEHIATAADQPPFIETLNIEATWLFEGPGQPAAPPYASFYLSGGQIMGPPAMAARRAYLAHNLDPSGSRLPPDHLALELGFVAHLGQELAGTWETHPLRALTGSSAFLREQLLSWVPEFVAAVVAATRYPFFVGLANLTLTMLETDATWLEDVLQEFQIPRIPVGQTAETTYF